MTTRVCFAFSLLDTSKQKPKAIIFSTFLVYVFIDFNKILPSQYHATCLSFFIKTHKTY